MLKTQHYYFTYILLLTCLPSSVFSNNDTADDFYFNIPTANELELAQGKVIQYLKKGDKHYNLEELDQAKVWYEKTYNLAKEYNLKKEELSATIGLGSIYYWKSNYRQATILLNKALQQFPEIITKNDSIEIITKLGDVYFYAGDFDFALEHRLLALKLNKNLGDSILIADGFFAIAEILVEKNQLDEAQDKLNKSLAINKNLQRLHKIGFCYDLLADIFHKKKHYKKSLMYRKLSCREQYYEKTNYNIAYCDQSMANTFLAMGQYNKALQLFENAKNLQKSTGLNEELILTEIGIADIYSAKGDCKNAIEKYKVCLESALTYNINPIILMIYEKLYQASKNCRDFEKAVFYQDLYYNIKDSILSEKSTLNIANLSTRHELIQKENELAIAQKDNKLNMLFNSLLSAVILFLLMIGSLIYFLLKKQYKYNHILKSKNNKIEEQFDEIKVTNFNLSNANKDLEQFAYITSHDLKAPLRTIGGYASLINRRYKDKLDENGQQFIQFIMDDINHMHTLLEDILAYSKLNQKQIELKPIDLQEVTDSVVRLLKPEIENKKANIVYNELPVVDGNNTQLFQLFQNLISNSLKFIPPDREPIISVNARKINNRYEIAVADNGIGIDESYQEKVFTLFKRLHTKKDYDGTGIGLSICKKIVERHHGKIWLKSDGKSGTTFYFTLPATKNKLL